MLLIVAIFLFIPRTQELGKSNFFWLFGGGGAELELLFFPPVKIYNLF